MTVERAACLVTLYIVTKQLRKARLLLHGEYFLQVSNIIYVTLSANSPQTLSLR